MTNSAPWSNETFRTQPSEASPRTENSAWPTTPPERGAHYNTFLAVEAAIGSSAAALAAYLDNCRVKRNELSYDAANLVSESDGDELLDRARELRVLVEDWIAQNHPGLVWPLPLCRFSGPVPLTKRSHPPPAKPKG